MAGQTLSFEEATLEYWRQQPDVAAAGMDPWLHYTRHGQGEGRVWPGEPYPTDTATEEPSAPERPGTEIPQATAAADLQATPQTHAVPEFPDFLEGLLPFLTGGANPMAHAQAAATAREFAERATAALPGIVAGLSSTGRLPGGLNLNQLLQSILNPAGGASRASQPSAQSSSTSRGTGETSTDAAVHQGVQCDKCGVSPITGIRYKSTVLHDFDVCEACEAKNDEGSPFIKIKTPGSLGRGGRWGRGRCGQPPFGSPRPHGPHHSYGPHVPGPHGPGPYHVPPSSCFTGGSHGGFPGYGRWRHHGFGGKGWQGQCNWQTEGAQQEASRSETDKNATASSGVTSAEVPAEMQSEYEMEVQKAVEASLSRESNDSATQAKAEPSTQTETPAPSTQTETSAPSTQTETPAPSTQAETSVTAPVLEDAVEDAVNTSTATAESEQPAASPTFSDNDYDILETTPLFDGVTESKYQEPEPEPNPPVETSHVDAQTAQQQRAKRWQKELVSFAGMGFTDFPKLLDLFEQHIGTPGRSGTDKVLDALLGA